jgi:hypothetical protein
MEAVFRPEIVWIFPVDSCQLPVLSGRSRLEIIGNIREGPGMEYCFRNSPEIH